VNIEPYPSDRLLGRLNVFAKHTAMTWNSIAEVGKHRAAAQCQSVTKLLPGRAEPRPSWSKSN